MSGSRQTPAPLGTGGTVAVDEFLRRAATLPTTGHAGRRGRLLFCMDATASREPTWDRAARIQGEMFIAAEKLGGLDVRLAFYRGFDDFKASRWTSDGVALARLMAQVRCLTGHTQIGRLFTFAAEETRARKLDALIFVGDAFEEEIDAVGAAAGQLGLLGVPAFMFQEGRSPAVARAFSQFAKVTNGAHCQFDASSPDELRKLLGAVAAYAAAGEAAMLDYAGREGGAAARLTDGRRR
ncbi:MAG: VWA domain-containing protein [Rhodospirillales bacterium]|nr:VWA domain-containing protein [Rhodospirillales bacterium]